MKKAIIITSLLAILAIGIYKFTKKEEGKPEEPIVPNTNGADGDDSLIKVQVVEPPLISFGETIAM